MLSPIVTKINKVNNTSKKRLNILCQPTHEGLQSLLGYLPHNFYMIAGDGVKKWDFHTRPLPPNHYLLTAPNYIPPDLDIDILFSQDRFGCLQRFLDLSNKTGVPVVHIDHALPHPQWSKRQIEESKGMRAHSHVYVAQKSKETWGGRPEDPVIYYGLDDKKFDGWTGSKMEGISVVNLFAQRDVFCGWNLWQGVAKQVPIKLVGENPGLSESAKSVEHLIQMLGEARFFYNSSQYSTFPLTVAEAMMVGTPVISTAKQELPNIIEHGVNGFLADTEQEAVKYAHLLLSDLELAKRISKAGRQTAMEKFGMDTFLSKWNDVFYKAYEMSL